MRQTEPTLSGEIAEILSRHLKADRIPVVIRRSAPALGGRSILEAMADGDEAEVLAALRAGFDWSAAV
jgi:hypothetical protein